MDAKSQRDRDKASRDARGGNDFKGDRGLDANTPRGSKEMTAEANVRDALATGTTPGEQSARREAHLSNLYDGAGIGDSVGDKIGNFIAGMFGFDEESNYNYNPAAPANPYARWSWDPAQTVASLAGVATGLPIGTLYGLPKWALDYQVPWSVDMGSSVIGPDYDPSRSFADLTGNVSGDVSAPQTRASPSVSQGVVAAPAVQSRSPLNNRIGGYSGGGYAMGSFGKKPKKRETEYLSNALIGA